MYKYTNNVDELFLSIAKQNNLSVEEFIDDARIRGGRDLVYYLKFNYDYDFQIKVFECEIKISEIDIQGLGYITNFSDERVKKIGRCKFIENIFNSTLRNGKLGCINSIITSVYADRIEKQKIELEKINKKLSRIKKTIPNDKRRNKTNIPK